jgi:hypothetical protein
MTSESRRETNDFGGSGHILRFCRGIIMGGVVVPPRAAAEIIHR